MAFQIITDTCCDLSQKMCKDLSLVVVPMTVNMNETIITEYDDAWLKGFYNELRAGVAVSTSAVNPQAWQDAMEAVLKEGDDVLVLAFSSGLSTTYQSAMIAKSELDEKYPDRVIRVVDTLCASAGEGLLVWYACKERDGGMTVDEVADWCEENKGNISMWFTVDDLMYLKRGGRISPATALMGTMLQIKPVLHVDDAGKLVSVAKARGRKAAIEALAKKVKDTGLPGRNDVCFISHGDCEEDAKTLAKLLKEQCGVKEVVISYIGAVVGSHAGPGTLAMFFVGGQR